MAARSMPREKPKASPAQKGAGAPAGAPLLTVSGLTVEFPNRRGNLTALRDVSFDVMPGEILGVVGESGAGKSMTGNAIIGLLEPPGRIASGSIMLGDKNLVTLPPQVMRRIRGKEIGAIFQDPLTSLNPLYKIGDMLMETLLTHLPLTRAEAEQRALDMLTEVGIPSALERFYHYPHQFSGGMRQRVVIALALCTNPRLVIADEPTTALDVSVQAQIINLLKRLCHDHGTAVMLITHDMGVIAETAHRVCVMYAGRVVEIGPVRQVIKAPRHPYTKGLMEAIPHLGSGVEELAQIEGSMPRLDNIPAGCAFHPRCAETLPACRETVPSLRLVEKGQQAACHLFEEGGGGKKDAKPAGKQGPRA